MSVSRADGWPSRSNERARPFGLKGSSTSARREVARLLGRPGFLHRLGRAARDVERAEVERDPLCERRAGAAERRELRVGRRLRRVGPDAEGVRDGELLHRRRHVPGRAQRRGAGGVAELLRGACSIQRCRLRGALDVRARRRHEAAIAGQATEGRVLGRQLRELRCVARRAADALVVETIRRHHRDALPAHDPDAKLGLAAHDVLMDRRVREASQRRVPRHDHGLRLVAVGRREGLVADGVQLVLAEHHRAHLTTPTRTLRKRAGAAP